MKRILYWIALSTLAVTSCSKTAIVEEKNGDYMCFDASHPGLSTKATESSFETGDKIGVFVVENDDQGNSRPLQIVGNWANNVATEFNGTEWNTSSRIFWSDKPVDVFAYYPYQTLSSVDDQPFAVSTDQNGSEDGALISNYEASDLLWANTSHAFVSPDAVSADPVHLQFSHIMSKIVVKLVKGKNFEGEFPDDATMTLHGTVTSALVDLGQGVAIKDPYGNISSINMRMVAKDTFEAVVVPQRMDSRRPFIEYQASGVSFLLEDIFNFKPGMLYTYNLTINSSPEQISVEIGGSMGGWN